MKIIARETSDAIIHVQIEKQKFYTKGWISWPFQSRVQFENSDGILNSGEILECAG